MILAEVRNYLQERGQATLAEIGVHFEIEPDALRAMLDLWIAKGKIRKLHATACARCSRCDPACTEVYLWAAADGDAPASSCANCADGR